MRTILCVGWLVVLTGWAQEAREAGERGGSIGTGEAAGPGMRVAVPNLARPEWHPYADPSQGREGYRLNDQAVNEFRLYDFYPRQADYYLKAEEVPELIPAHPGMEAGLFGHWGKYSQFHLSDTRWRRMDFGSVLGGVIRPGGRVLTKAITVSLAGGRLATCFDPLTLTYPAVWSDGFLTLGTRRWGMMSNLGVGGTMRLVAPSGLAWTRSGEAGLEGEAHAYLGYYRHGDEIVFRYRLGETHILDHPSALPIDGDSLFTRTLRLTGHRGSTELSLFSLPNPPEGNLQILQQEANRMLIEIGGRRLGFAVKTNASSPSGVAFKRGDDGLPRLVLKDTEANLVVKLYVMPDASEWTALEKILEMDAIVDPESKTHGAQRRWPEAFTLPGIVSPGKGPYVVDTLPVPTINPYQSMMFLSGLSFFENGDAAVATFFGDVWRVTGINDSLEAVRWKRYATGLNQPLGLEIVDGKVFVLGKDQITILHDLNGNQEADYYENFCHDFVTSPGGHDYNTGLQRDAEGNFYFATKHAGIYQISPDGREAQIIATGLRNPNGIGVSPGGRVVTSPQQGQWAPASMIIEAQRGAFYGFPKDRVDQPIAPPLCYVPRGVDNSTGGQLFVNSDRWGPLKGQLLSFSFGDCSHYLVLRDAEGGRPQGAVVPLRGEFESGAHRARFHPVDGQLYVVGSQGWGNYAVEDGSFQRVRYTGMPVYYPSGFQVFENGIRVDFPRSLADETVDVASDLFAQQWNYQYSKGYGSPEFSVRQPERLGHDRIGIRSAHVLPGRKSLFVEMPDLIPVMQVHLRMHLNFEDGTRFSTDLYPTILRLGSRFTGFPNPAPGGANKPRELELRILDLPAVVSGSHQEGAPGRPVTLKAITGLKYDQPFIKVKAGERVSLTLENTDVMPHNWVLVGFEGYTRVGEASVRMLNDPLAFQKQFVPASRDVIVHTPVVNPNESVTIHFNAPTAAGEYPYLCTYPGHWQLMRGTLIVY